MNTPGGGYETRFSDAVATPASRARFINSLLAWLDTHKLDGCARARQGESRGGGRPRRQARPHALPCLVPPWGRSNPFPSPLQD